MADITQIAVANMTATSTAYDVSLNNYINLGTLDRPILSSVVTRSAATSDLGQRARCLCDTAANNYLPVQKGSGFGRSLAARMPHNR